MMKTQTNIIKGRAKLPLCLKHVIAQNFQAMRVFESQRDFITQPRVVDPRTTLGYSKKERTPLKGLRRGARHLGQIDATPLGLKEFFYRALRVGARCANPGLNDAIPFGLSEAELPLHLPCLLGIFLSFAHEKFYE